MGLMKVSDAARHANCHSSTIYTLIKKGKLKSQEVGGLKVVDESIEHIRQVVDKYAPKHGMKLIKRRRKTNTDSSKLSPLMEWLEIPKSKRELLMDIAKQYTETELKLILEL